MHPVDSIYRIKSNFEIYNIGGFGTNTDYVQVSVEILAMTTVTAYYDCLLWQYLSDSESGI